MLFHSIIVTQRRQTLLSFVSNFAFLDRRSEDVEGIKSCSRRFSYLVKYAYYQQGQGPHAFFSFHGCSISFVICRDTSAEHKVDFG